MNDAKILELAWEQEMVDSGYNRYHKAVRDSIKRTTKTGTKANANNESNTSYGISIIKECIDDIAQGIETAISISKGKPGANPLAYEYLAYINHETTAYLTCKTIMDSISISPTLLSLAKKLGQRIEDNTKYQFMEDQLGNLNMKKIEEWTAKTSSNTARDKKKAFEYAARIKTAKGELIEWLPWPKLALKHIGFACINIFREITGFIDVELEHISKNTIKTVYYVIGTEKVFNWIKANKEVMQWATPDYMPMISKPRDWSNMYDGGYYNDILRSKVPLVKTPFLKRLNKIDMPEVYKAVNHLQDTKWCINDYVLDALSFQLSVKHGVGMPGNEKLVIPDCPLGAFPEQGDRTTEQFKALKADRIANLSNKEKLAFAKWKGTAQRCYQEEKKRVSKLMQIVRTFQMAKRLQEQGSFWFIHQLDFTGREYPLGAAINPQGADISKALLKFKRGVPLGEDGFMHLKYHCAGVYGIDDCSLADRLKWIDQHQDMIIAIGTDAEDTTDLWKTADKPYCFLAVCEELAEIMQLYKGREHEFISYIPCNQDGKCNGIQHFSAMIRDQSGAEAVNMLHCEKPNDIYGVTAGVTRDLLSSTLKNKKTFKGRNTGWIPSTEQELKMARLWAQVYGIDRGVTKKPTMIVPYGGTKLTCSDSIEEYMQKQDIKRKAIDSTYMNCFDDLEGNGQVLATRFLNHYVWESLDTVVSSARTAMKFLQDITKAIQKAYAGGSEMEWSTPAGFRVIQETKNTEPYRIKTKLDGSMLNLQARKTLLTVNSHKMATGVPPNFVHALDACHLMKTVNKCKDAGIMDFMAIHDSFGTHAGNVTTLHTIIRDSFISVHQELVLKTFWLEMADRYPEALGHFPLPSDLNIGDFNLEDVKKAEHFFR